MGGRGQGPLAFAPIVLAASYAAAVFVAYRPSPAIAAWLAFEYAGAIGGVALFLAAVLWLRALLAQQTHGPRTSGLGIVRAAAAARWRADRLLGVWQPLVTFVVAMTAFSIYKQLALPGAGFGMGPAIADADRALLGTDAWRIAHRLLPSPWATQLLDAAYHAWFAPMTLGIALCAFAPAGALLARRYVLGYALLWVVQGSALAAWLPAAGPIYFAHFQAETGRFAELSARLAEQHAWLRAAGAPGISALSFQEYLLRLFGSREIGLGGGISAMPSLHNAMAVLFVCAARHLSPRLGWMLAGYAVVIWFGSIQLGWHYALDGIVAAAATLATWKATGLVCHGLGSGVRAPAIAPAGMQPARVPVSRS